MVYWYNVILFNHKEKYWYFYNINESWKHYTKWKKPETKGHILCDSIYMRCPEQENPRQKMDLYFPEREKENAEWLLMGWLSLWGDENVWWLHSFVNILKINCIHLKGEFYGLWVTSQKL